MKRILEVDPLNDQAKKSIRRLEPLAEQKREKMKEEMIGKTIDSTSCAFLTFLILQVRIFRDWTSQEILRNL